MRAAWSTPWCLLSLHHFCVILLEVGVDWLLFEVLTVVELDIERRILAVNRFVDIKYCRLLTLGIYRIKFSWFFLFSFLRRVHADHLVDGPTNEGAKRKLERRLFFFPLRHPPHLFRFGWRRNRIHHFTFWHRLFNRTGSCLYPCRPECLIVFLNQLHSGRTSRTLFLRWD